MPVSAGRRLKLFCYILRMTTQPPANLNEAIAPITARIKTQDWHINRALCLGAAGASLAVALVVAQLFAANPGSARTWALWLSATAVPVWMTLWAFCEPYAFFEESAVEHSRRPIWVFVGLLLFAAGGVFLATSVIALLAMFSTAIAISTGCVSLLGMTLAFKHNGSVRASLPPLPAPVQVQQKKAKGRRR